MELLYGGNSRQRNYHDWLGGRDALLCAIRVFALLALCESDLVRGEQVAGNAPILPAPRLAYLPRLLYIPVPDHLRDATTVSATCSLERVWALPDVPHGFDAVDLSEA